MNRREMPDRKKSEHRKSFLVSSAAGSVFGLATGIIFLQQGYTSWPPALFIPAVALGVALFSGCAGLIGSVLEERLKRKGIKNALSRLVFSFGAVALLTLAITFFGIFVLGGADAFAGIRQYALVGAGAGITFGAVFALLSYRVETNRQKMLMLELENRHLADLAAREELLREAARNLAVAEERNRMARELHDSISQGIHGIVYSLRSLRQVVSDNPRGRDILGHLEETADETLKELRRLVMELTPSPLEDHGLEEALRLHCDLFARRQKVDLNLNMDYKGQLQPDQEVAVYRITQEALANIQKHAEAKQVEISLRSPGDTVLSIRDDGRGFDPEAVNKGHGLTNMASRARQSGGSLQIDSHPGRGTTITVRFQHQP